MRVRTQDLQREAEVAEISGRKASVLSGLRALDASLSASGLKLEGGGLGAPAGWFLGPKAENKAVLHRLIASVIDEHCDFRTGYKPGDPTIITDEVKATAAYKSAIAELERGVAALNKELKRSAPVFSMRSHGHMLWDQVLPGMIGYFAGMLYNQNNVAAEASPVTTWLEIQVSEDLCRMLGYEIPAEVKPDTVMPWGHITCDGSVANIEAMWAARNAKFFALAVSAALKAEMKLDRAREIKVRLLDGTMSRLIDLDAWQLVNLRVDDVVLLPQRIAEFDGELKVDDVTALLGAYLIQNIGILEFYQRLKPGDVSAPMALVPSTAHYSWPKAGTLLGIGQSNIVPVHVDLRARMQISDLDAKLRDCLARRVPVIAVVAVIGSTEESSVDPLDEILALRETYRAKGLDFIVHCDAAWGGYFASMLREKAGELHTFAAAPDYPMSDYVTRQYAVLPQADSITVDPHKAGYVPYPAGALCYRNSALRDLISLRAPVVYHSQSEPTVGIYGIEGSKPGAAATAVYLAHRVIRPDKQGYGKILSQCVWTSKRMYCRLLTMEDRDRCQPSRFKATVFQMLPAEISDAGADEVKRQRDMVASFVDLKNDELLARLKSDADAEKLFREIGSDQVILTFALNFRDPKTGAWNTDPKRCNDFNNGIYEACSIVDRNESLADLDLILTGSEFGAKSYGADFVKHFSSRIGLQNPDAAPIAFLISTTMNPWSTDTENGDFLAIVEDALRSAAELSYQKLHSK